MRGQILEYDYRTGAGEISGEDGQRYRFSGEEWRPQGQPRSGQSVDFQHDGGEARAIFAVGSGGGTGSKNKIVAALLAFFLGGLGIHKFYLGKNTAGIIMLMCSLFGIILLFIPTLIVGLIAFAEFIIYLVTSDEDFEERYVRGNRAWF
jgi:TM2 domain-containing membrane protein YozV